MDKKDKREIIIIDDQNLFAKGLKELLEEDEDIEVIKIIETTNNISSLLSKDKPDAILLDLNMPKKNGFDVLKEIRKDFPDLIIAILSTYDHSSLIKKAKRLGANAYLSKDATITELREVIFKTHNSNFYLSKELGIDKDTDLFDSFIQKANLTEREVEIITFIAKGLAISDIADKLHISQSTIKTHKRNIYHKLNISSVAELVRTAYENKIL